jgi:hypothetical protein
LCIGASSDKRTSFPGPLRVPPPQCFIAVVSRRNTSEENLITDVFRLSNRVFMVGPGTGTLGTKARTNAKNSGYAEGGRATRQLWESPGITVLVLEAVGVCLS